MIKRLYKQPRKIGKEIDAILNRVNQLVSEEVENTIVTTTTTITNEIITSSNEARAFTFFMS